MFGITMDANFDGLKEQIENSIAFYNDPMEAEISFSYEGGNIAFNESLVKQYYDKVKELYPNNNFKITINYVMKSDYILDTEDCKNLEKVDEYLRNNQNSELTISAKKGLLFSHGFRKTLNANRKLDDVANKIKNATNDGEPLSTYEKFMVAYEYVTNYAYNEGGDTFHNETSHWVPVIEGDKIVCAGYASLLRALCERIFTPEEVKVFEQGLEVCDIETGEVKGAHANNLIYINDEKYGIKGMYYADACWDCINDTNRQDKPQAYCCIPLQDIMYNKTCRLNFDSSFANLYLHKFDEYREFFYKREYENYCQYKNSTYTEVLPDGSDGEKVDLELDEEYVERTFEELVEDLLIGLGSHRGYAEYYLKKYPDIIKYDSFSSMPNGVEEKLEKEMIEFEKEVDEKYGELLKKYSGIKVLGFLPESFIEKYGIQKYLDKFDNPHDEEGIREAISALGDIYSRKDVKKLLNKVKNKIDLEDFEEQMKNFLCNSELYNKRTRLQEKYKLFIQRARESNANHIRETLDEMIECTPVPIQAFVNSYTIIGKQMGLKGQELCEYVEDRINKSIERTNENFDIVSCSNCFAMPLQRSKKI